MIKISVIIPVYNREKYIGECLNSVLFQTLKEIEVICIDDGSTDGTYDLLMDYKEKYKNIIVLHQENQGSGPARNMGIEYAQGKYICFMDSDDYYAQDCALEHLYRNAEENHAAACRGNFLLACEDGGKKKVQPWFSEKKMLSFKEDGDFSQYTCYIFSRKLIQDNYIMFPIYKRFQDPPFFLKVMSCAQNFMVIDEPVYVYRQWERGLKWDFNIVTDVLKGIRDCFKIAKENNFTKIYDKYLKKILNSYLWIIYPHASQGELWELIDEINEINREWMGEYPEIFHNQESLEAYVAPLKETRDNVISKCQKAEEVVIYGAGEVGQFFLQNFGNQCGHIVGFAVSTKYKEDSIKGYEVKEIRDYSKKALIIVAAKRKSAVEILKNLERMQFENVCYIDYVTLKLIERILRLV